jgi:hypothetical protein
MAFFAYGHTKLIKIIGRYRINVNPVNLQLSLEIPGIDIGKHHATHDLPSHWILAPYELIGTRRRWTLCCL